ncbi:MAG: hypothetical protein AVDCRST_MAG53-237, partial [uncultured Solirubrobacteraceae bacterium]
EPPHEDPRCCRARCGGTGRRLRRRRGRAGVQAGCPGCLCGPCRARELSDRGHRGGQEEEARVSGERQGRPGHADACELRQDPALGGDRAAARRSHRRGVREGRRQGGRADPSLDRGRRRPHGRRARPDRQRHAGVSSVQVRDHRRRDRERGRRGQEQLRSRRSG